MNSEKVNMEKYLHLVAFYSNKTCFSKFSFNFYPVQFEMPCNMSRYTNIKSVSFHIICANFPKHSEIQVFT